MVSRRRSSSCLRCKLVTAYMIVIYKHCVPVTFRNRMDVVRIHFPSPQVITISANKDGMQNALLRKLQMTYPSATFDVSTGNIPIAVLTIDLSAKDADAVATLLNDMGATLDLLGYALTYQKVNAEGVVYDFSRTS